MAEHTPTPWLAAIEDLSQGTVKAAIDGHMIHIATISGSMTNPEIAADAAFIVKAVNAHDDLVIALTEISCTFDGSWRVGSLERSVGDKARAALSKIGD